ncbi:MAG: ribosome small subunit-dependent GTPase A, partial [Pseudobdellovibrionaceae bacterium]
LLENGKIIRGVLSGKFQSLAPRFLPCVGDWVVGEGDHNDLVRIEKVLERKSQLVRGSLDSEQSMACNMDFVLVASSASSEGPSDLSFNRLDRYLSLIWSSGATPIVVLTKTDLLVDANEVLESLREQLPFVSVIGVSVFNTTGVDEVGKLIPAGKSALLVGSSGVGKSTLSNALVGGEVAATQAICEEDGRGRHTTTARHLYQSRFGGWILDSPGLRTVPLIENDEGVNSQFEHIVELETKCKFTDCLHKTEPGCAIKSSLDTGELPEREWESYQKLQRELMSIAIRKNPRLRALRMKRIKEISKFVKAKKKGLIPK